jgi:hypothetical protein
MSTLNNENPKQIKTIESEIRRTSLNSNNNNKDSLFTNNSNNGVDYNWDDFVLYNKYYVDTFKFDHILMVFIIHYITANKVPNVI